MEGHNLEVMISTLERIVQQQKLIENKMRQTELRIFQCIVDGNQSFEVKLLTRKSVLQGVMKMLIMARQNLDKKIQQLITSNKDNLDQSLEVSFSELEVTESIQSEMLSFRQDDFSGLSTELLTYNRTM